MESDDDFRAVKLPFSPQEYACTWHLPRIQTEVENNEAHQDDDGKDGFIKVNGTLDLTVGHHPHGSFYGELPIVWEDDSTQFPQINDYDCLTGKLSTGAHFALINGQYNYWFLGQGYVNGAFAILSRKPFKHNEYRTYQSIELQLEGLDKIIDVNPAKIQVDPGKKSIFSATCSNACWEWRSDDVSMKLHFIGRARRDPFNFTMRFAPVLQIKANSPLTIVDWWRKWTVPIQELLASAIGRTPDVMYMLAIADRTPKREWKDQIFRWDIKQESLYPNAGEIKKSKPAIKIQEDGVNLLDLLIRWRELHASHHPLIETYDSLAFSADQHPRSRFLLLVQALEGLYGFEHQEERCQQRQAYREEKRKFLDRMREIAKNEIITEDDYRFLRDNLMPNPFITLESTLIAILDTLSGDVKEKLAGSALIRKVRESEENTNMKVETVLAFVRNKLSHGATSFEPGDLDDVAETLDRVVRAELLRVLGAPEACRLRLLGASEA